MHTVAGDGVAGIKRRRRDLSSDGVRDFVIASRRGRLKEGYKEGVPRNYDPKGKSTRSSTRNLFPPLDNPTPLNDFEMAAEEPGYLPFPDLQTMEELCQPSLNGRGRPIAPIVIQATNIGLKNDMIQQVQNSCQFHGLPGDDANKHLDKFLHVTQSIKVNGLNDDALRVSREIFSTIHGHEA
uniref:Reverse transcriptase domain-containing protein n=1 Tax=Tanacetum cinerariifolium TaxID=118510 RepID=A0A6L2K417_TANCI|nr:reverse transcriptase domain-containing protein [Tanacetum cinerariifolium]